MTDILVVSNNYSSRIAYSAALTGYGYEVTEAQTVSDAYHLLANGLTPKAIIVDMKFSNALLEAYRNFETLYQDGQRPALIIVGGAENEHLANGLADLFLTRPVQLHDLLNQVHACLQ